MTICWIFFFFALSMFFFLLGEDIGSPSSFVFSPSLGRGISLLLFFCVFSEKKQKKKKTKFNKTKKESGTLLRTLSLSFSLSLSLRFARYKIHARAQTHARRAKSKSNFFVSSLEELSEVKKRNAVGCFYLYTHIVR